MEKFKTYIQIQLFAESVEIEEAIINYWTGTLWIWEQKEIQYNKYLLVIRCGEMNILKNIRWKKTGVVGAGGRQDFEWKIPENSYGNWCVFKSIHLVNGKSRKIQKRRRFLSQNENITFQLLTQKMIQKLSWKAFNMAFYNGNELIGSKILTEKSISGNL